MDAIYTAEALATGGGRDGGHVVTSDGQLDVHTALPTSMGIARRCSREIRCGITIGYCGTPASWRIG